MKKLVAVAVLAALAAVSCQAQPHWYKSKKFWVPIAVCVGSMSIDYVASERAYGRGATEANPIFGQARPSLGRLFAIGTPIELSYALASYRMANSESKILRRAAFLPPAYSVAGHIWGAQRAFGFANPLTLNHAPISFAVESKPQKPLR